MVQEAESLGREGVQELAGREFNTTTLVIGFDGANSTTAVWQVQHPTSLDPLSDEGLNQILNHLEDRYDLQRDTAIVISDLGSGRPIVFGCADPGVEETRTELATTFVEL
jgi:hypothetical protein